MRKALISVVLIMAIFLSVNINAYANNLTGETESTIPNTMQGTITDPYGVTYEVQGRLLETECVSAAMLGHISNCVTYAFDIYSDGISLSSTLPNSSDATGYTYQSTVTVTINYESTTDYPEEFLLKSVSGNWDIDDSRVSVTSGFVNYACTDYIHLGQNSTYYLTSTNLQNMSFYKNTNFSQFIAKDFSGFMGATLTLNYLMGDSRTWSFSVENIRFNNV